MNRFSIDKITSIIWLVALLFLTIIPLNKSDRFQDNQTEIATVSKLAQINNIDPYFDLEESEDASKHLYIEFYSFPDCHFRETAVIKTYRKYCISNKDQIDITFFNLPPPAQNS